MRCWLSCSIFLLLITTGFSRTWHDQRGKAIEADLLEIEADSVVLIDAKGESKRFEISIFSEEDQAFIESQREDLANGAGAFWEKFSDSMPEGLGEKLINGIFKLGKIGILVLIVVIFVLGLAITQQGGRWAGNQTTMMGAFLITIVSGVLSNILGFALSFITASMGNIGANIGLGIAFVLPFPLAFMMVDRCTFGRALLAALYTCLIYAILFGVVVGVLWGIGQAG